MQTKRKRSEEDKDQAPPAKKQASAAMDEKMAALRQLASNGASSAISNPKYRKQFIAEKEAIIRAKSSDLAGRAQLAVCSFVVDRSVVPAKITYVFCDPELRRSMKPHETDILRDFVFSEQRPALVSDPLAALRSLNMNSLRNVSIHWFLAASFLFSLVYFLFFSPFSVLVARF
jgi:hypothetical protein